MATYRFDYFVRLYNGSIGIEGDSLEEARTKFDELSAEELRENTNNESVTLESITDPDGNTTEIEDD